MTNNPPKKTLELYPIDYPFETLLTRITAKDPKLILNPDFQRKYKWDKEGWVKASKFIESCLMRIPLPSCYFAEDEQGRHLVIDGVQRLTTMVTLRLGAAFLYVTRPRLIVALIRVSLHLSRAPPEQG